MRSLILTGFIIFLGVNLIHGQIKLGDPIKFSSTGLEVENHEDIRVVVAPLHQNVLNIGLTKSRIESRVNIRLRQVGLRPNTQRGGERLNINITVVGSAFNVLLTFNRGISFKVADFEYLGIADVYSHWRTGTHGQDPEYIISNLDILLDDFLSDYLDANE